MIGQALRTPAAGPDGGREPFAAFLGDDVTRETVARIAAERGWPAASVETGGISAAARALAVVEPPRILMVDVSDSADPVADVAALAGMLEAGTALIALGRTNDVAFFRAMLAAGAADYLLKPATGEAVREALARAEAGPQQGQRSPGRLILFTGARGGVGASTIATNCAWIAANELRRRVILADLDLQFGTVALSLDLDPGPGLREALSDPDRIDDLFVERAIAKAGEHLAVLGSEEPFEETPGFAAGAALKLIAAIGAHYDLVMVDLPGRLAVAYPELLAAASELVVVCDLSLASLRDTNRLRRFFKDSGCEGKVSIVANLVGAGRRGQLTRAQFEKGLESRIDCLVPADAKNAGRAANVGAPLAAARSPARGPLTALSVAVTGAKPIRRGIWRLIGT